MLADSGDRLSYSALLRTDQRKENMYMAPRRTVSVQASKLSRYRLPLLVGVAGVLLLVLGFVIPGWWWLALLGLLLCLGAGLSQRSWWTGDWIPGWWSVEKDQRLWEEKDRDHEDERKN